MLVLARQLASRRLLPVLIGLVAVGIPVAHSVIVGSWQIPRNDDWAYSKAALGLHDTGSFSLWNWNDMFLIGQLVLAQPFLRLDRSLGALHAFSVTMALLFAASSAVVGQHVLGRRRGWLFGVLAASSPLVVALTTTYMTDLPTAALAAACVAVGVVAASRGFPIPLLIAAVAIGLVGVTIRQTAIVAPAAVVLCAAWSVRRDRAKLATVLGVAGAAGALLVAFVLWRAQLPFGGSTRYGLHPTELRRVPAAATTLALLCSPLLLLPTKGVLPDRWKKGAVAAGVLASLISAASALMGYPLVGNYLLPGGVAEAGTLLGQRPDIFPAPVWSAVVAFGVACVGLLVVRLVGAVWWFMQKPRPLPIGLIFIYAALMLSMLLYQAASGVLFDRYLLIALLPISAVIVAPGLTFPPRLQAASVLAGVALFAIGLTVAFDADRYDRDRWVAGQQFGARFGAVNVDAGFEWTNWTEGQPKAPSQPDGFTPGPTRPFYAWFYPGERCVLLANHPLQDPSVESLGTLRPDGGDNTFWVYQRQGCGQLTGSGAR